MFCFLRIKKENKEDFKKRVFKTGYGVGGYTAQPRKSFYNFK